MVDSSLTLPGACEGDGLTRATGEIEGVKVDCRGRLRKIIRINMTSFMACFEQRDNPSSAASRSRSGDRVSEAR